MIRSRRRSRTPISPFLIHQVDENGDENGGQLDTPCPGSTQSEEQKLTRITNNSPVAQMVARQNAALT